MFPRYKTPITAQQQGWGRPFIVNSSADDERTSWRGRNTKWQRTPALRLKVCSQQIWQRQFPFTLGLAAGRNSREASATASSDTLNGAQHARARFKEAHVRQTKTGRGSAAGGASTAVKASLHVTVEVDRHSQQTGADSRGAGAHGRCGFTESAWRLPVSLHREIIDRDVLPRFWLETSVTVNEGLVPVLLLRNSESMNLAVDFWQS